jgi:ribosomal protein L11 methyltransferase
VPSSYSKITIQSNDESLIAMLGMDFPFESFEENEEHTIGYIISDNLTEEVKSNINNLIGQFEVAYEWESIEDQNWNEVWESNFQPVNIEGVCRIRAEFHDHDASFPHEIVIQPKMAFGTGHHQTTYTMIKTMNDIDFKNKTVYDYGCGTGILAIFASMLGSGPIDAVDIENESYLNTIENAERNNIHNITAFEGDIHSTPLAKYDIILANINRNILLASSKELAKKSKSSTILLLSGILTADIEVITMAFQEVGFTSLATFEKEGWVCMKLVFSL